MKYAQFWFLEKGLGIVYFTTFSRWFFKKKKKKRFSCHILLTDQTSLSDWLYFLRYWAICVLQLCPPGCDVIDFEINLIFLIKLLFSMFEKSDIKFKYLEDKKIFQGEIKSIFHHFWRAFICQKLSQIWESALQVLIWQSLWSKDVFLS